MSEAGFRYYATGWEAELVADVLRMLSDAEIMPMASALLPLLAPACETSNGRWTAWDALNRAMSRTVQIWVAELDGQITGIAVTTLIEYPGLRACKLLIGTAAHSTPAGWRAAVEQLMAWAKSQNCARFEADARIGWERVFAGTLQKTHVFLESPL